MKTYLFLYNSSSQCHGSWWPGGAGSIGIGNILTLAPEGIDLYRKLLLNEYMNIYIYIYIYIYIWLLYNFAMNMRTTLNMFPWALFSNIDWMPARESNYNYHSVWAEKLLKFGNGLVISSHTLQELWLSIHAGIPWLGLKSIHVSKGGHVCVVMIWVVILCRIFVNQHWKQYWLKGHSTLMLCYVMLCYFMLCCVVSCRVVSCRVVSRIGAGWHGMVWYGMAWHGMAWYGMVCYAMVCYGMVWYRESEHVLRDFFGRLFLPRLFIRDQAIDNKSRP